jgi:hypothetical protein
LDQRQARLSRLITLLGDIQVDLGDPFLRGTSLVQGNLGEFHLVTSNVCVRICLLDRVSLPNLLVIQVLLRDLQVDLSLLELVKQILHLKLSQQVTLPDGIALFHQDP